MTRPLGRRFIALGFLALVLLAVAWVGWQVWHVNRALSAAADDALVLEQAIRAGDDPGATAALERLKEHSADAADRTDGVTWAILTKLPWYGDDARGVQVVSDVVYDLAQHGIEPLTTATEQLDGLLPSEGRVSVEVVEDLRDPVAEGKGAFAAADDKLSGQDSGDFIGPLRDKYRELAGRIEDAEAALTTADTALQVMPGMLGSEEPRRFLLVFQNNAEIRATGGLPGAVAVVTTDDGKIELRRQVATSTLSRAPEPALPLSPAEEEIYGEELGTFFLDANFTPDFPRTAALMGARWEQEFGTPVDGVISLDPVALSYILQATGPVTVGDVTLDSANVVDELLHQVYLRYADPDDQDAFFTAATKAIFDRVSSGVESPQVLIEALARGTNEHRILVHPFAADEQDALGGSTVAGALETDPKAPPQVGVYLNDATGAKMSYFLRHEVRVTATYCRGDRQGLSAKAHLLSAAPDNAAELPDYVTGGGLFGSEPGSQLVLIRLYGPVDGTLSKIALNSKPLDAETVVHDGREVSTVVVSLEPGFTADLTWRMTTGPGQTGDIETSVTPGVEPRNLSSTSASACA